LSGLPCGSPSTNTEGTSTLPAFFMLAASTASVSSASSASVITLLSSALPAAASPLLASSGLHLADEAQAAVDLGLDEERGVTIVLALASASWSISLAWMSRGQGQRPMLAMLWSSIAMIATRSEGWRALLVLRRRRTCAPARQSDRWPG
jgi:hypothetical protein